MSAKQSEQVLTEKVISDPALQKNIWEAYVASFADCEEICAQDQLCYDQSSFIDALEDPEYKKWILYVDNDIVGMCFMTNNLIKARIAYCNDRFLRHKYPETVAAKKLYYCTALYITHEAQAKLYGQKLLAGIIHFFRDNQVMVAFDYSESKNAGLAEMVAFVAENVHSAPSTITELDKQRYVAIHITEFGEPS